MIRWLVLQELELKYKLIRMGNHLAEKHHTSQQIWL